MITIVKLDEKLPFVSVIIPTYHDWERLKLCINGLHEQTYPREFFEVIIINNDPADFLPPSLDLTDNCLLITDGTPGSYAARNAGIRVAKGTILAFTDSDCIPQPRWIEAAVTALSLGADRVAGKVELFFKSGKLTAIEKYEKALAFQQDNYVQIQGASVTANLITYKSAFQKVGLFDQSLFSGGDMEWGWRARDSGLSLIYSPEAVVLHPARRSIHEILRKKKRIIGGSCNIARLRENEGRIWFFMGFFPPIGFYIEIFKRNDLEFSEKIIVSLLEYLIRLHKTIYQSLLLLGFREPIRK